MSEKLLQVEDLTISLRVESSSIALVEDVSFEVGPGEVLALVGESGSGKSVTALALMRLLPNALAIHAGRILFTPPGSGSPVDLAQLPVDGEVMRNIRGNEIAMIFQEPMASFSPVHTIGDHIADVLRAHGYEDRQEVRDRTIEMLDRVHLPDPARAADRYPHELSGGMRQRAMIAKALCCGPSLLIADEPTTALDVTIQAQILDLLSELREETGMALIFITHDLGVVAQIADTVAVMYTGNVVERGPKRAVFRSPRHPYTHELLAATPDLDRGGSDGDLRSIRGHVPGLFELPTGCTFHPRCDSFISGRCEKAVPPVTRVEREHEVRCHLYE